MKTRESVRRNMSFSKTYSAAFASGMTDLIHLDLPTLFNGATITIILGCITLIMWLVYRERQRSREHIYTIDSSLAEDRYALEHKISHRTLELVDAQKAHRQELERVAEFGKLSKGLFHDLIGPLSAVSLSVERLAQDSQSSTHDTSQALRTALEASQRMASFMESIRAVMQHPLPTPEDIRAESARELAIVLDLLAYKARVAGVEISIRHHDPVIIPVHPVRLQQLFLNIISNALEAHGTAPTSSEDKKVIIDISRSTKSIRISVTDNGPGIPPDHAGIILKQPFTTKKRGTGTGLMTVKSIVEEELMGTIHITNVPNIGTVCEITIPFLAKD